MRTCQQGESDKGSGGRTAVKRFAVTAAVGDVLLMIMMPVANRHVQNRNGMVAGIDFEVASPILNHRYHVVDVVIVRRSSFYHCYRFWAFLGSLHVYLLFP